MRRKRSLPLKALGPLLQREEIVERDPDALLERLLVLAARREVRREQDSLAIDARHDLEHARDLARRDALEVQAAIVDELQDLAVRVRLHRVEHGVHGAQRLQRRRSRASMRLRGRRRRWRRAARRSRAAAPSSSPTRASATASRRRRAARELLPGRAEHAALELVHEQAMQVLHELDTRAPSSRRT